MIRATRFMLAALVLACPGVSSAQFEPGASSGLAEGYRMDMLQSLVRDHTVPKPRSGAKPKPESTMRETTSPPLRVSYASDVSAVLRDDILRESTGDQESDRLLRSVVTSGRMMSEYGRLMSYLELSPNDLADVMTAYLLVSMEAVNGRTPTSAQRRVVRREVAARLVATPELHRLSARDRQVLAERYAYSTLSTGLTFQVLSRSGRPPQLAQFRERVRRNVSRATGIDPARVTVSESGLSAAPS